MMVFKSFATYKYFDFPIVNFPIGVRIIERD